MSPKFRAILKALRDAKFSRDDVFVVRKALEDIVMAHQSIMEDDELTPAGERIAKTLVQWGDVAPDLE